MNGFAEEVVLAEGVKPGFDVDAACPKRGADDVEGFLDAVEGGKSVFAGEVFGVVDSGATLFDSGVAGLEAVAGFPESVSDSDDLVLENVLAKMLAVAESPCVRLAAGESVSSSSSSALRLLLDLGVSLVPKSFVGDLGIDSGAAFICDAWGAVPVPAWLKSFSPKGFTFFGDGTSFSVTPSSSRDLRFCRRSPPVGAPMVSRTRI